MEPITHLASGMLGAQATAERFPPSRAFYPFCLLAAWAPDVDNLASLFGRDGYLALHRGLTHSLVGVPVMALITVAVFKLFRARLPWLKAWGLACVLGLVHVYLDLITNYGTQVLAPFSNARFSLPAVFIIDPIFTGTLLVFILLAHLGKPKRRLIAAAGLMWLALYPMTNLSIGNAAKAWAAHVFKQNGFAAQRVHATPEPFTPIFWKVIAENNDTWAVASLNMLDPKSAPEVAVMAKADREELRRLGEQDEMFKIFEWFSVYPFEERTTRGNRTEIVYGDLRFITTQPWVRQWFGNQFGPPFRIRAVLGPGGELIECGHLDQDAPPVEAKH